MAHDILIVDDESDIRMLIAGILEDDGYQTRSAGDSTSALGSIRTRSSRGSMACTGSFGR